MMMQSMVASSLLSSHISVLLVCILSTLCLTNSNSIDYNAESTVRSLLATHDGSSTMSIVVEFDTDVMEDQNNTQMLLSGIANLHTAKVMGRFAALDVETQFLGRIWDDLSSDPHFVGLERDSIWTEQGFLEKELFVIDDSPGESNNNKNNNHVRERRRRAQEMASYGVKMIQGDLVEIGPSPTSVCVVDTGVARGHPDLDFNRISGIDRISNIDEALLEWDKDMRGHGTHTTGIISAISNNNLGVQGMGKIPVFVTRGLNNEGKAKESDIVDALDQCEAANAKVISLSLAGPSMNWQMRSKLKELYEKGFLILAASGNQGGRNQVFPASDPLVISVAAVTSTRTRWYGSNFGPWIELAGPGALITSTSVNSLGQPNYSDYSGTSMATPFVAAAAALIWSHFPSCTNTQIRYALAYTATGNTTACSESDGYGIVQTKDAYDFLTTYSCDGANWGKLVSPDGMCSTIDEPPSTMQTITGSSSSWGNFQNLWQNWKDFGG